MSTIKVTNLRGRNGSPTLPDGAVVTGVATATTFSGTLDGSLKSTGTPTLGLGVTINSSGINVSGVLTATTLYGDGSNLTGVGESIAPWNYNPSINDSEVTVDTGIGITFNKKINAGSGTATLKIVNAGVAGTTIQSWGVSSCTFNITEFTMGALVSNLSINQTYQLDIPEGFIVDNNETSYAGTAYTFASQGAVGKLWGWGYNTKGTVGDNSVVFRSSPVQIPGTTWEKLPHQGFKYIQQVKSAIKEDGTLWSWGYDAGSGHIGAGTRSVDYSSPVQIEGGGTNWSSVSHAYYAGGAIKTDGTLWTWGSNSTGQLGLNQAPSPGTSRSSPTQVPGTTWRSISGKQYGMWATRTDGTLWGWGAGGFGELGQNNETHYSSPTQIPGTDWTTKVSSSRYTAAIKTNGTMYVWGVNSQGNLGLNDRTHRSSPTQLPGTTWAKVSTSANDQEFMVAIKTDGTLWAWGKNPYGQLGQNNTTLYSSPVQVGSDTTWSKIDAGTSSWGAIKTDGTLWMCGLNNQGDLGQNTATYYSSPVQIPGTEWIEVSAHRQGYHAIQRDQTP